jgi:hypothetical protein
MFLFFLDFCLFSSVLCRVETPPPPFTKQILRKSIKTIFPTTISAKIQKLEIIDKGRGFLIKAECFLFQILTLVLFS